MEQATLKPRTIFCRDNLELMRGINSDSIDLIYLDPPFNKGRNFHAPIGTSAEGADFEDIWSSDKVKDAWVEEIEDDHPGIHALVNAVEAISSKSAKYYLIFMAMRLLEIRRILKPTGSVYLHCDPTANSHLRLLMDAIFGWQRFRNEIVWCYTGPSVSRRQFPAKHDTILFYAEESHEFNPDDPKVRLPYKYSKPSELGRKRFGAIDPEEQRRKFEQGKLAEDWWDDIAVAARGRERVGYPTQKPLSLLERILSASSRPGDLVLDPFCGCATTCVAAELLGRNWIGVDVGAKAYELVRNRLAQAFDGPLIANRVIFRTDIPQRTDRSTKIKPTPEDKKVLYSEQGGKCAGCQTLFEPQHLTIDHVVPLSRGGWHDLENLQLLCGYCNSVKGNRSMGYLQSRLQLAA